jgi:hypothetical protein
MAPETLVLAERAERARLEALDICRETTRTLGQLRRVRTEAALLRGEPTNPIRHPGAS